MKPLLETLFSDRSVWLVVHNNPDPDSLASAFGLQVGLRKMGFRSVRICYDGIIGRAENKTMLKVLQIHLVTTGEAQCSRSIQRARSGGPVQLVLLDAQPGAGNVTLPAGAKPQVVIDHHPLRQRTKKAPFFDVRPDYGACSTSFPIRISWPRWRISCSG